MGEIAKPFNLVILASQNFNSSQAKSEREVKELQRSWEKKAEWRQDQKFLVINLTTCPKALLNNFKYPKTMQEVSQT